MKYLQYKQKWQREKGFTLVETLVAITILLVAIVGPMTIAARGLQTAFYAREQITAFSLAQEGVELIREKRDENALSHSGNWLQGVPSGLCGSSNPDGCGLDIRGGSFLNCNGNNCQLKYDSAALPGNRGFYTYTAGTPSLYTRRIFVTETVNGKEALVTVKVTWQSGLFGAQRTVTVQSRIFNQYNNL